MEKRVSSQTIMQNPLRMKKMSQYSGQRVSIAQAWANIFQQITNHVGELESLPDEYIEKNRELQRCFAKAPEFFREHMKSLIVQELRYIVTLNMTLGYEEWHGANMYYFFMLCADSAIFIGDDFESRRKLSILVPLGFSREVSRVKMMMLSTLGNCRTSELPEHLW